MYNIAFFADSHLGYSAKVPINEHGVNMRVQDGYDAFTETLSQIVKSEDKIDAVIHGGDLFHYSRPTNLDQKLAQTRLRRLSKLGLPFYGLAGNHDTTDEKSELAAVAILDDPEQNINLLYKPYEKYEIADGIWLHSVSHHGLDEHEAPEVKPVVGALNLFTTHGAALDPKNESLLRCEGSPREQIIPLDLINDENFIARLLGHYHSRYAVGSEALNTWYSGSSVRRGFSDDAGQRGWLLVQIDGNGNVKVTPKNIHQRPQFDLPAIDARGLVAADVMDLLEINMARTHVDDPKAPIVRQRILNSTHALREGLDRKKIASLQSHMLLWDMQFPKAEIMVKRVLRKDNGEEETVEETEEDKSLSLTSSRDLNIVKQYDSWMKQQENQVPEQYRDLVEADIRNYLVKASEAQ